jgi:hypothetical protein
MPWLTLSWQQPITSTASFLSSLQLVQTGAHAYRQHDPGRVWRTSDANGNIIYHYAMFALATYYHTTERATTIYYYGETSCKLPLPV